MIKRTVYYIVEIKNNIEKEPKVAFYSQNVSEEFIRLYNLPCYNGCSGYKIEEGQEKSSVKVYNSVDEYTNFDKREQIRKLQNQINKLRSEIGEEQDCDITNV